MNTKAKTPALLAREALKMLAERSLPPTPANFQACYNEIAGTPNVAGFPEVQLRELAEALVPHSSEQESLLSLLDAGITHRSWKEVRDALIAYANFAAANLSGSEPAATAITPTDAATLNFRKGIANLIEAILPPLIKDDARLRDQAEVFLLALRSPAATMASIQKLLDGISPRTRLASEEQEEIRHSLLKLLHLVIENIGAISLDDHWLRGQVDALLTAVAPPLTLRRLDDVERRVRDVMYKQTEAKSRSVEVRDEMRQMLAEFISSLATMSQTSSVFEERLTSSSHKLGEVKSIEDLAPLLKEVIDATRSMAAETAASRSQLEGLQTKVRATENELVKLHRELDSASAQARHDPLTDALNRKGLDEALEREIARMRRKDMPLSIALLDLDNFKRLNDQLGHETGDAALVHLVRVARECLRPADTLARYGGEEFVILMPDTGMEQGIAVMTRLQRELTKSFFLSGEEKVLITFSAGVAQLGATETGSEAIRRADEAMYLAKRTGKNRVLGG